MDRQQGGTEQLKDAGYDLYAAFPLSVLLDYYVGANKLSQVKREEVMTYIVANR